MNWIEPTLSTIAETMNRPFAELVTIHLLESLLRRICHSAFVSEWVLRGGMLTRTWVPPGHRVALDLDFLALYPFGIASTQQRFQELLLGESFSDGVCFYPNSLQAEGIWMDTPFPGVRLQLEASLGDYSTTLQIDVGFGDPIVPSAQWITYPTLITAEPIKVLAVRPETMAGWKLHGLVERGTTQWRPKDLYDLMLFAMVIPLDETLLPDAIAIAFSSRDTNPQDLQQWLDNPAWWQLGKNRRRWRWYLRKAPTQLTPEDYSSVVATVINYWKPHLDRINQSD